MRVSGSGGSLRHNFILSSLSGSVACSKVTNGKLKSLQILIVKSRMSTKIVCKYIVKHGETVS